ncbi:hypothetical protein AvCA_12107 [Azotobacter vinelandii CA]|uniref:Uncharacterized protein n=2 Tax=Azotobacter vinelandii TaxID=354 RepID=C1DPK5_AZOVD|nr:hypothetical protein Avin_12107 [Azotobacter vinelandii DJ]AGK15375.1 hypothetical protein AvCA_12107 [Azotobacter vinelandii CA]AGK19793.1 hypothetical protein AvCA6_12107 [Azotobacter vinelandii CA6]
MTNSRSALAASVISGPGAKAGFAQAGSPLLHVTVQSWWIFDSTFSRVYGLDPLAGPMTFTPAEDRPGKPSIPVRQGNDCGDVHVTSPCAAVPRTDDRAPGPGNEPLWCCLECVGRLFPGEYRVFLP